MPGPESIFWTTHVAKLKNFGPCKRLEDTLEGGVSDVVYCLRWLTEPPRAGWCELKRLPSWPVRASTKIKLPHYTVDQANFLKEWGTAGMGAYLLAQVADSFLLWHWSQAHAIQAGQPRGRFESLAMVNVRGRFPLRDILRCLTR